MSDTALDVRNLEVHFQTDEKTITAVDGISFQLKRGETLGIVGESGSGKSVTSLAVMGLVPTPPGKIARGEIWFNQVNQNGKMGQAVNLLGLAPEKMQGYRGSQLAMIFQEPMSALNPVYTIGFQLVEAIRQHQNISPAQAQRQAIALLQEVKLLPSDEELRRTLPNPKLRFAENSEREILRQINEYKQGILKRYPHELSGGQIQRVTIAMAISCNPTVLVADEPTTALDVTVQATILDLLRELRDERNMSMIFISHDLGVIAEIADTVAVMYEGKIVEYGSVWEIFSNPQHPYTKGLLACRPQPNQRLRYLPTVADFMEVVQTTEGKAEIREKRRESGTQFASTPGHELEATARSLEINALESEQRLTRLQRQTPLVSVRNLQVGFPVSGMFGETKRYTMAVNGVSFDVYPGETLGLVGESGCGKTTLARSLLRLVEPMGGELVFEGQNILKLNARQLRKLRREMQIIFQDPFSSLNPRMKIGEAILEPLLIHDAGHSVREKRDRAVYLLQRVGLTPEAMNRYPHEFSGGQRQRACIARSLALNPKFILCDESVSALDVSVQAQVLNLLKELQQEFGLTYIFISHDLSVVKFMSDRIMVMNRGQIEEIGPAEQVYRAPQKAYTRQLINAIPTGTLDRIKLQQAQRSAVQH